jgi:hypothetical protein
MTGAARRSGDGVAATPRRYVPGDEPLATIAASAAATAAIALTAAGFAILARRVAGGFAASPTAGIAWLVVAAGLGVVIAIDVAVGHRLAGRWVASVARAGLFVAALAMLPTFGPGSLVGQAAIVAAAGAALVPPPGRRRPRSLGNRGRFRSRAAPVVVAPPQPAADAGHHGHPIAPETLPAADEPPGLRQRFARFANQSGEDRVVGRVLVELAPGSRAGHAHVGFCPPFAALPTVEVTTDYDGVEAVVSAAEVLPWGLRVECRLSEPAEEPVAIPVEFVARHPA